MQMPTGTLALDLAQQLARVFSSVDQLGIHCLSAAWHRGRRRDELWCGLCHAPLPTLEGLERLETGEVGLSAVELLPSKHIELVHRALRAEHEASKAADGEVERVGQHANRVAAHGGTHAQVARAGHTDVDKQALCGAGERV